MHKFNRSIINEIYLGEILKQNYKFDDKISIVFWRTGIAGNDTYEIYTSKRKYLLKIYCIFSNLDQVKYSIETMILLRNQNIKTPQVIHTINGENLIYIDYPEGKRIAAIFEFIEGIEPDITDKNDAEKIGTLLSNIHKVFDDFESIIVPKNINKEFLVLNCINLMKKYVLNENKMISYFENIGNRLWDYVESNHKNNKPEYGICHGDFHSGNMKKDQNGDIFIFDFDAYGIGYRIYDIGVYANINWMPSTLSDLENDKNVLNLFLKGYLSEYRVLNIDIHEFHLIVGLRHFELLGMILKNCTVFEGIHWIEENIKSKYEWFKSWENLLKL